VRDNFFITVVMVQVNLPEEPISFLKDLTSDEAALVARALVGKMREDPKIGPLTWVDLKIVSESEWKANDPARLVCLVHRWHQILPDPEAPDRSHPPPDSPGRPGVGLAESRRFQRYLRSSRMRREAHVRFLGGGAFTARWAPTRQRRLAFTSPFLCRALAPCCSIPSPEPFKC